MAGADAIRETAALYGPEALSDAQILQTLFSRGASASADKILQEVGGLGPLTTMGPSELSALGLTKAEVSRILAVQEFMRRSNRSTERPCITSPRAAAYYLLPKILGWTEERFGMLALNAKGLLLADRVLALGTSCGCLISPREFFREALRFGATTALAWHNHPSGDPTPSKEDGQLTQRLRASGESLGVPLADHIILGAGRWHSFRSTEGWGS